MRNRSLFAGGLRCTIGGCALDRQPQSDRVIGRVHEILLGPQIPLGRLDRCVAQEQLVLFELSEIVGQSVASRRFGIRPGSAPAGPDLVIASDVTPRFRGVDTPHRVKSSYIGRATGRWQWTPRLFAATFRRHRRKRT
jgi:hypothetical protein